MVPRGVSESEFKRLTVDEYLRGDYGVTRAVAEELAEVEWQIRQEVENARRLPHGQLRDTNSRAGFGLKGMWLGTKEKKPDAPAAVPTHRTITVSRVAFKALRTKGALSVEDISYLFSGADDFLSCYARPLGFPEFEPRIKGYRTWKVYGWLEKFARHGRVKVRT
jgi:hypothetical protein